MIDLKKSHIRDYITDLGDRLELINTDTGKVIGVGRYGVWVPSKGKMEVVEVSDDLEHLQKKYGPNLPIYPIPNR